jgi:hypothetical protein
MEALRSDRGYTHVLLMDDDIEINPEALQRTYALTALVTPAYKRSFIAGSMFLGDIRDFQWEARSKFKGLFIKSYAQLPVSRFPSLLINEFQAAERDPYDYAAWWCCCIPWRPSAPTNCLSRFLSAATISTIAEITPTKLYISTASASGMNRLRAAETMSWICT